MGEEVGLGLQHKRSIASDADWMLTSSESELSENESIKDKASMVISDASDYDGAQVDLDEVQESIKRSQSILAESVMEASILRDKQAIANQNMELTRKKQRERAKKKLARRLKARETAFVAPAVVHMVASPSPSPHLRENENG